MYLMKLPSLLLALLCLFSEGNARAEEENFSWHKHYRQIKSCLIDCHHCQRLSQTCQSLTPNRLHLFCWDSRKFRCGQHLKLATLTCLWKADFVRENCITFYLYTLSAALSRRQIDLREPGSFACGLYVTFHISQFASSSSRQLKTPRQKWPIAWQTQHVSLVMGV